MATGTYNFVTKIRKRSSVADIFLSAGKSENNDLQANALFDVSHITAVVTGGATGIGLSKS